MSGSGDPFRANWRPFSVGEAQRPRSGRADEEPVGYARHVRGKQLRFRAGAASSRPRRQATSPAARLRAAFGAKEVAVKVISFGRDVESVKRQIRYIARDGEVPLERADGEVIEGDRAALDAIAEEWSAGFHHHGGKARNSIHMMVSVPAGMDRDAVEMAARSFADATFGASRDYVMVRHDDTDHPHVHLIAETIGADGARLSYQPEDFQGLRERFAEACREEGLDVTATPRAVRGVVGRADEDTGLRKLRERGGRVRRALRPGADLDRAREVALQRSLLAEEAEESRALAGALAGSGLKGAERAARRLEALAERCERAFGDGDSGGGGEGVSAPSAPPVAAQERVETSSPGQEGGPDPAFLLLRVQALQRGAIRAARDGADRLPPGEDRDRAWVIVAAMEERGRMLGLEPDASGPDGPEPDPPVVRRQGRRVDKDREPDRDDGR